MDWVCRGDSNSRLDNAAGSLFCRDRPGGELVDMITSHYNPEYLSDMEYLESPSYSSRKGFSPQCIVMHYTAGGNGRKTAEWFTGEVGRSAHFMGFRDGTGVQQVPLALAAWHAGASKWLYNDKMRNGVNRFSIGIELANFGLLHKGKTGFWYEIGGNLYRYRGPKPKKAELIYDNGVVVRGWWEPYPEKQISWAVSLVDQLVESGIPRQIVGHQSIAQPFATKKKDPGPLFPWPAFGMKSDHRATGRLIAA